MGKYKLNEHYFDQIDSEEKAYLLGFLFADGYNSGHGQVNLGLAEEDRRLLEAFRDMLYGERRPLYTRPSRMRNGLDMWVAHNQ